MLYLDLSIQSELVIVNLVVHALIVKFFTFPLLFFSFQKYRLAKYLPEKKEGDESIILKKSCLSLSSSSLPKSS